MPLRDDWTETTLGKVASLDIGRTPARNESRFWTDDLEFPFCTIADMVGKLINPSREGVTRLAIDSGKARLVKAGTLLMSFKLTLGRVGFAERDLFPNEAIVAIAPFHSDVLREYLYLLLGTQDLSEGSGRAVKGSTLNSKSLAAIPLLLPSRAEQRRIVDLVSSVDAYIDSLQQKVDSAREARNAVLHELMSAGGADWTETTLGELVSIQSGFAFSTKDWTESGYPVIKINNVRNGKVSTEGCSYITDPIPKGAERFTLHRGDLLITLTGEIGATGVVSQDFPMYLNQRVGKISLHDNSRTSLDYVALTLDLPSLREEMWSLGKGNAQLNISPKSICELSINMPPLDEQKRIVELIISMDDVVAAGEQAVADAKNLRSGLLSDLLSGQHEIPKSYDQLMGDK